MVVFIVNKSKVLLSLIFSLSIIFTAKAVSEQQLWTLEACIEYAHQNNLSLRQQRLGIDIARENLLQSKSERFPNLNLNATHGYNYGRTIDPFTNEFATERVRSNNFGLSSGVVLFSGFQITNSIKKSELELDVSKLDVDAVKNDISLWIASAYLEILFNKELVEVSESQLEITRQQAERTRKLVEAGTLPRGNLYTIEAQAASEELQLINAKNSLQMAYLNLAQLLDLRDIEDFRIDIPDIDISADKMTDLSPLEIYNIAVNDQPNVKASQVRVMTAEKDVEIARGDRYPMLSMQGSYGTGYSGASREIIDKTITEQQIGWTESNELVYGPSVDYQTQIKPFIDQLDDNLNRSIGFYLSIPVFNNLQTRNRISRSKIALENSKLSSQNIRNQLFKEIQQAHADALAALKKHEATEKNVEALEESFKYTEQRFNVGMADPIEYNDAKNRLASAESELLQAKYEFIFRVKIIDFYMGNPITI